MVTKDTRERYYKFDSKEINISKPTEVCFPFLYVIQRQQKPDSTLCQTDTFAGGLAPIYISILETCPSSRGSTKRSKERQRPTLGVCFSQVSIF